MNESMDAKLPVDDPVDSASALEYPGALPLDVNKYLPHVEEFDMSEEQKVEFLKTLWSIMSAFVDLGWGVDTVQNFIPSLRDFSSECESPRVNMEIQSCGSEFMRAASTESEKGNEHD